MDDSPGSAESPLAFTSTDAPRKNELSLMQAMRGWLRHALRHKHDTSLKEMVEEVIEEHEEQGDERLAPEEKVMLHNVLSFSDIKVSDIMAPRAHIAAVPLDIGLEGLKAHISAQRHTRIPVYEETLDKVRGFIHVKDLLPMLAGDAPFALDSVMRELLFVPPSMRIIDLLIRMRHANSHMAIVVDEYGGTDGLVTMEDLFEEIVGDIQDEHDGDEQALERIQRVGVGVVEVDAGISIETLEKELGAFLSDEEKAGEFDTLGGLIFAQLGHVPARGEMMVLASGGRLEIIEADPRRIRKVRIVINA